MTIEQVFDSLSVRLKQENVGAMTISINWAFTDIDEKWVLGLSNRTLWYTRGRHDAGAAVSVTTTRRTFIDVVTQVTSFLDQVQAGTITLAGDPSALQAVFGNLEQFAPWFAIVEP